MTLAIPLMFTSSTRAKSSSDTFHKGALGAITAALFLAEFVGDIPWAHLDIAGTAQSPGDVSWQTAGCTGFGARLLLQLAADFKA